ncbi:MAG: nucleotidyl transferase AbiEii/AbiGii toxin family protein [bacterium]
MKSSPNPIKARNVVREYLQARILGAMQRAGAMVLLAFHGGTALRFLYGIPRYSEDLDFTLEGPGSGYDFHRLLQAIRSEVANEGYAVTIKANDRKTVHSAFIRFSGLMYEMGLSPMQGESLSVKVEIDTRPPVGVGLTTTVVRRHVILQLYHHDRSSLLAGKVHALLSRAYTKGRDIYDLFWYFSDRDWPSPNFVLLNNALRQTGWNNPDITEKSWRGCLRNRLKWIDWDLAVNDVRPFLESEKETELLTFENMMLLLKESPMNHK